MVCQKDEVGDGGGGLGYFHLHEKWEPRGARKREKAASLLVAFPEKSGFDCEGKKKKLLKTKSPRRGRPPQMKIFASQVCSSGREKRGAIC